MNKNSRKINCRENVGLDRDIIHDLSNFKFSCNKQIIIYVLMCHYANYRLRTQLAYLLIHDNYPLNKSLYIEIIPTF